MIQLLLLILFAKCVCVWEQQLLFQHIVVVVVAAAAESSHSSERAQRLHLCLFVRKGAKKES